MNEHNDSYTDDTPVYMQAGEHDPNAQSEHFNPSEVDESDEIIKPEQDRMIIRELEQEKDELNKRLLRLQADFDNYRKRSRAEKEEIVNSASFELVRNLLPVIDNLERACDAAEGSPEGLVDGVSMITRQLKELLQKEGLQAIDCKGQPFDPQCHDAVLQEESDEYPPNTVVDELQKGYMMKNRVLRPSMVKVAAEK